MPVYVILAVAVWLGLEATNAAGITDFSPIQRVALGTVWPASAALMVGTAMSGYPDDVRVLD